MELGAIDKSSRGNISLPENLKPKKQPSKKPLKKVDYPADKPVATRKAYGNALVRIYPQFPNMVSLDGKVSNSTYSVIFKEAYPERFFEMYIAEQNMIGAALGLSCRGNIPFVSTFAPFLSRAFDQIRMSQYSDPNIKFVGSHAGVSIGEDGPSQMGLEDIAMFRTISNSIVFYPSDAVSAEKLIEEAAQHYGIVYIRTTRKETPILYNHEEQFTIGGSKVLRKSEKDSVTVIAAGITLHEALEAYEALKEEGVFIRIIDLYSIKPIDETTLRESANATKLILTVKDHYAEGGLGEAVKRKAKSGKPQELLDYEEISWTAITKKVKELL